MADPDAPWDIGDFENPPPDAPPAETPAEGVPAEAAPAEEVAPAEEPPPEPREKKKLVCRHWVRPIRLQYIYNFNYRKNYYDDYINYLDSRRRGLELEVPHPQTWAERALRTYNVKHDRVNELVQKADNFDTKRTYVQWFHTVHTKDYYTRKYDLIKY